MKCIFFKIFQILTVIVTLHWLQTTEIVNLESWKNIQGKSFIKLHLAIDLWFLILSIVGSSIIVFSTILTWPGEGEHIYEVNDFFSSFILVQFIFLLTL